MKAEQKVSPSKNGDVKIEKFNVSEWCECTYLLLYVVRMSSARVESIYFRNKSSGNNESKILNYCVLDFTCIFEFRASLNRFICAVYVEKYTPGNDR